jgi:hypothetical protein
VEILLPKANGHGEPVRSEWFEHLTDELAQKFGGVTSFLRTPGRGLWHSGSEIERDAIAIIEVMTDTIDGDYWGSLKGRLEEELFQREIVIRSHEISQL